MLNAFSVYSNDVDLKQEDSNITMSVSETTVRTTAAFEKDDENSINFLIQVHIKKWPSYWQGLQIEEWSFSNSWLEENRSIQY